MTERDSNRKGPACQETAAGAFRGYRFEVIPNGPQRLQIRRFIGACRFVFNRALSLQNATRLATGKKQGGYAGLCKLLTSWRNDPATSWLADAPVHVAQQALVDLETAWMYHFRSLQKLKRGEIKPDQLVGQPRFRKKGQHESFRYPDAKQFRIEQENSRIFLPKLGWLRYRKSRAVEGEIRNVTVTLSGGKCFVSILTKHEVVQPVHPSTSIVGIDMGISKFAALSTGDCIAPLGSGKKWAARLKRAQRTAARRKKFSNNWKKIQARVALIHIRIANARRDFLHKHSTTISKNHAVVCVEDLRVRNMSASAAGTVECPGRNVKAKSGLNRSILDQGWRAFRTMLEWKAIRNGGRVVAVPPQHTSQTCPQCRHVSAENRRTQARFACVACGYADDADVVAAINVLHRATQLMEEPQDTAGIACGDTSPAFGASAQEPTEANRAVCA